MQIDKVSLADTHSFSNFFLDYIHQHEKLKPFYQRFPEKHQFRDQLTEKATSFTAAQREVLVRVLQEQYQQVTTTNQVKGNISALLQEKTFTITTGHQLNIFTGPLYFIYKIITVINTCKQLKEQYPEYTFVPVYWMASEDHDYEEIKYMRLYGKKYEWNTKQQGAVGRFHTNDFHEILTSLPGEISLFKEAYKKKTLSEAVRHYVNALFQDEGLVVIDADNKALKAQFTSVIKEDIFEGVSKKYVDITNAELTSAGYKPQVNCRDINFFYLADNLRARIEKQDDKYVVLDTSLLFSKEELTQLITESPEKFSPNVILRPLYQEMILPNLAYIGGPAEVIYWLQLKNLFQHFNTPFPILMPRNFSLVIDHEVARKFAKTQLALKDLFEPTNYLFNHWVLTHSPRNLTVGVERAEINRIFDELQERASLVDTTLSAFVGAAGKRSVNSLEKIERKILRAEKRLHADKLEQIEAVKDALFPNGNLQERTDNFLNFYQQDTNFIQKLLTAFDPFDFRFVIMQYPH